MWGYRVGFSQLLQILLHLLFSLGFRSRIVKLSSFCHGGIGSSTWKNIGLVIWFSLAIDPGLANISSPVLQENYNDFCYGLCFQDSGLSIGSGYFHHDFSAKLGERNCEALSHLWGLLGGWLIKIELNLGSSNVGTLIDLNVISEFQRFLFLLAELNPSWCSSNKQWIPHKCKVLFQDLQWPNRKAWFTFSFLVITKFIPIFQVTWEQQNVNNFYWDFFTLTKCSTSYWEWNCWMLLYMMREEIAHPQHFIFDCKAEFGLKFEGTTLVEKMDSLTKFPYVCVSHHSLLLLQ